MDRRKKRTSTNQYMMYIELMEKDAIFATGRVPRDVDSNYLQKKWKELANKLNSCGIGPTLTAEEWRKRLNDWKNTTRCKYRRSLSGEKDIAMTSLEIKALELFGKAPNTSTDTLSVHLKSEKDDNEEEVEQQRTSESFQKELQAAVEEAIGGDDDDDPLGEDNDEQDDVQTEHVTSGSSAGAYRTIVVENAAFTDDENNEDHVEYITARRHTLGPSAPTTAATAVQTVVTTTPSTTVTKLINGDIPLKRLRTNAPEQIIYEVKKAPTTSHHHTTTHNTRGITIHNSTPSSTPTMHHHHIQTESQHHNNNHISSGSLLIGGSTTATPISAADTREIGRQLKRLADIKSEKLKFEIARFKFNNPGFHYNHPLL